MPIPDSLPWMESVDARLARAREHYDSFAAEATAFSKGIKANIVLKSNEQGEKWLVLWDSDYLPPPRLSVLVGEVLFNLRSALDHVICGLARRSDAQAPCLTTEFPIFLIADKYARAAKRSLIGVPTAAATIIRQLQPFQRPPNTREQDPLWLLHELNNRDKHRAILFSLALNRSVDIRLSADDRVLFIARTPPQEIPGPVIVPVPTTIPDDVRCEAAGYRPLTFREPGPWQPRPIDEVLNACLNHVELNVIQQLKPFFEDEVG